MHLSECIYYLAASIYYLAEYIYYFAACQLVAETGLKLDDVLVLFLSYL